MSTCASARESRASVWHRWSVSSRMSCYNSEVVVKKQNVNKPMCKSFLACVCACARARRGGGGSSQSDASDWSWRSARLYSRAVKQEDAEDQSRCVRWQLSESRQWTSSQSLTPGEQITDRRHCLQLTGAFLKKGPEVRRGMDRSRGYHRNCCWHSFREVWGVWKLPCDSVRYHADTYAEYVKLFVKSCNSNESLLPRLLCKVWISVFIACVWLCSWRAATFFMRCSHFYVQQLHSSVSVLSVCISVGYSRCCYADWLEPRSDSSTVTPILRPGLHSQKETFTALHFSIQRDNLYWAADVTQLYVLTWIIQRLLWRQSGATENLLVKLK